MFGMNSEMVTGLVRHVLTTFGGVFVTQGLLTGEQLTTVAAAAAILAGIVWSMLAKKSA